MLDILKTYRIDIISLLLVIISTYFLGIPGFGITILLLIIYYLSARKKYSLQKLLLAICLIGILLALGGFALFNGMESKGIDSVGEAVIYAAMINIGRIMAVISSIIILIIDNRKSKKS